MNNNPYGPPPGFSPPPYGYGPPGAPPPMGPPPNPMNPMGPMGPGGGMPPGPTGNNGLAVASMVCGILAIFPGCCCGLFGIPLSIVALVMGLVAMNQINQTQGMQSGKGMAIAGLVCGGVSIAMDIVSVAFNFSSEILKSLHV